MNKARALIIPMIMGLILTMLIILGTTYITVAKYETDTRPELVSYSGGSAGTVPGENNWIFYEDLKEDGNLLCNQKGGTLRGTKGGKLTEFNKIVWPIILKVGDRYPADENSTDKDDLEAKAEEQTETPAEYASAGGKLANPWEAYVLSKISKYGGGTEFTPVQIAWWGSHGGSHSNDADDSTDTSGEEWGQGDDANDPEAAASEANNDGDALTLKEQADAYMKFVCKFLPGGKYSASRDIETKDVTVVVNKGKSDEKTMTLPNRFKIDFKPEFSSDKTKNNPTVKTDGDTLLVGPFSINFEQARIKDEDGNYIDFAAISGIKIITDVGTLDDDKWEFQWVDGERADDETSETPLSGEKFYIRIKDIGDAKKIVDLKIQFKYMNGCGKYIVLNGTIPLANWELKSQKVIDTPEVKDPVTQVVTQAEVSHMEYWLEVDSFGSAPAQQLNLAEYGALWYEFTEISWDKELYDESKIIVKKKVFDKYGTDITEYEDKNFKLKLNVSGARETGEEIILINPTLGTKESKVYTWAKGDTAPTFTLEEDLSKEQEDMYTVDIGGQGEKYEGSLKAGEAIRLDLEMTDTGENVQKYVKNTKDEYKGKIVVEKNLQIDLDKYQDYFGQYLKNQEFEFKATIKGALFYYGKESTTPIKDEHVITITAKYDETEKKWVGESDEIKWTIDNPPKYEVTEVEKEGYEITSWSENKTGEFVNQKEQVNVITVEVKEQTPIEYSGILKIEKRVDITDLINMIPANCFDENGDLKQDCSFGDYLDKEIESIKNTKITVDVKFDKYLEPYDEENPPSEPYEEGDVIPYTLTDGSDPIKTTDSEGNIKWEIVYSAEIITKKWLYGEVVTYSITEIKTEGQTLVGITIIDPTKENPIKELSTLPATGVLRKGKDKKDVVTISAVIENKIDITKEEGTLEIIKEVHAKSKEQLQELLHRQYAFSVVVDGPFIYNDELYPKGQYQFSNIDTTESAEEPEGETPDGGTEEPNRNPYKLLEEVNISKVEGDTIDEKALLVIQVDDQPTGNKDIGTFKWFSDREYGPHFKVKEMITDDKISHTVTPEEGYIGIDNEPVTKVVVRNTSDDHGGGIQILKYIINSDKITDDVLKQEFRFKVTIDFDNPDRQDIQVNVLLKDPYLKDGKWWWKQPESEIIWVTWQEGEKSPKYKVEEIQLDGKYSLLSSQNTEGWFVENENYELPIVTPIFCNTEHSSLSIKKEVKDKDGNTIYPNYDFKFLAKVNGETVEGTVNGKKANIDSDGYLYLKAGETFESKQYVWETGTNPPSYDVEEIIGEDDVYHFVDISTNNGQKDPANEKKVFGTLSEDPDTGVFVTCENKSIVDHEGRLEITKKLQNGESSTDKFSFETKIGGVAAEGEILNSSGNVIDNSVKGPNIELEVGQTFRSKVYKWNDGESGPSYSIKENPKEGYEFVNINVTNDDKAEVNLAERTVTGEINDGIDSTVKVEYENKGNLSGKLKITKKVYTPVISGNKEIEPNKKFKFTVAIDGVSSVTGKIYNENGDIINDSVTGPVIELKAKQSFITDYIPWENSENPPRYTVTESVDNIEPFRFREIKSTNDTTASQEGTSISGTLSSGKEIEIICENEMKGGFLTVTKQVEDLSGNIVYTEDAKQFTFNVSIDGVTQVKGSIIDKDGKEVNSNVIGPEIKLKAGEKFISDTISWDSEETPSYVVEEINPESPYEFKEIKVNKDTTAIIDNANKKVEGHLNKDGSGVDVICINRADIKKGKLVVTKKVESLNGTDQLYPEQGFKFNVTIGESSAIGEIKDKNNNTIKKVNSDSEIVLKSGETFISKQYVWIGENAPKYTVVEHEPEAPYKLKSISVTNDDDATINEAGRKVEGYLSSNVASIDVTYINTADIEENFGYLNIAKIVKDARSENGPFKFKVSVEGETQVVGDIYEGNNIIKQDVTITPDENLELDGGQIFKSKVITWEGEQGPEYTITEIEMPEGYTIDSISANYYDSIKDKTTIKGHLQENGVTVEVTYTNIGTTDYQGFLELKKAVENPIDINNDLFAFNVNIIFEDGTVELAEGEIDGEKARPDENGYIYLKASQTFKTRYYTWFEEDKAPVFEVKEVGMPEKYNLIGISTTDPEHDTVDLENATINGPLKDNGVYVTYTNEGEGYHYEGNIKIKKDVDHSNPDNTALIGKTFKYNVKIYGTVFEVYDGSKYIKVTNPNLGYTCDVEVQEGEEKIVFSKNIVWRTSKPPKYEVTEYTDKEHYDENMPEFKLVYSEDRIRNVVGNSVKDGTEKDPAVTTIGPAAYFKNEGSSEYRGQLVLSKQIEGEIQNDTDDLFTFEVRIAEKGKELSDVIPTIVKIKAYEKWESNIYYWGKGEQAPKYSVKEIEMSESYGFVGFVNNGNSPESKERECSGTLLENDAKKVNEDGKIPKPTPVIGINKYEERKGNFILYKNIINQDAKLTSGLYSKFAFKVTITGNFSMSGESPSVAERNRVVSYVVTIDVDTNVGTANYTSPEIFWYGETPPIVTVDEINIWDVEELSDSDLIVAKAWNHLGISNNNVNLVNGETVKLTATNEMPFIPEVSFTFKLAGDVWEDKDSDGKNIHADGLFTRTGEQGIEGVEVYIKEVDSNEEAKIYSSDFMNEIEQPIITGKDGHWEAPGILLHKVKNEDDEETFEKAFYVEYVYDGQTYEPTKYLATSNGDASTYIDATTEDRNKSGDYENDSMALDTDRSVVDGRITEVKGYSPRDNSGKTTGQVVLPEVHTEDGEEPIDNHIYYEDSTSTFDQDTRKSSKLITKDENGRVYKLFKATAATTELAYPFDSRAAVSDVDMYIVPFDGSETGGIKEEIKYSATYDYCLHVNLGLIRRKEVDLTLLKDLVSVDTVIKEELQHKDFNTLEDLISKTLSMKDNGRVGLKLGLYDTDYYYRAEIYNSDYKAYNAVSMLYANIDGGPDEKLTDKELEIYLKYVITIKNNSNSSYLLTNISLNDYFDSSFGSVIDTDVEKIVLEYDESGNPIYDGNGNQVRTSKIVARKPYFTRSIGQVQQGETDNNEVVWEEKQHDIHSKVDNKYYTKMTTDSLRDQVLANGDWINVYVSFKLSKSQFDELGVTNIIELGEKSNVAEIAGYSTYYNNTGYTLGNLAGKIDSDSAPDNIDIINSNIRASYEDDTDSSPVLKIEKIKDTREISGIAWEDNGDGKLDIGDNTGNNIGEARIGGLTTQLVQKITVNDTSGEGTSKVDYDFLWPTDKKIGALGGKTLEQLTGFDSTTESSRTKTSVGSGDNEIVTKEVGSYSFVGIPSGKYVVRYIYGDYKANPAEALTADGENYYNNRTNASDLTQREKDERLNKILTANYDNDVPGETPAVYNGQDYKVTIYQENKGDLNKRYLEFDETDGTVKVAGTDDLVSSARDSESRRLQVIAESETITYELGSLLAKANELNDSHAKLYELTEMYADTPIVDISKTEIKKGQIGTEYTASGIDRDARKEINIGLVERPENEIVLDKEIKSINLTTNDGRTIFRAEYNVKYEAIDTVPNDNEIVIGKVDDKYIVANVELASSSVNTDVLQAADKIENKLSSVYNSGTQNFRYINVDSDILQGATIEINYILSAINVGEKDYVGTELTSIFNNETEEGAELRSTRNRLLDLAKAKAEAEYHVKCDTANIELNETAPFGEYLGNYYYTGEKADSDQIVETRVRQLIDYVDTDALFTQEDNQEKDHSWKSTNISELQGGNSRRGRALGSSVVPSVAIIDKGSISYISKSSNNIVLSADASDEVDNYNKELNRNTGFQENLEPFVVRPSDDEPSDNEQEVKYMSQIELTISKVISAQDDTESLEFDNLAEIIKYENAAGRRDTVATPGNASPKGSIVDDTIEANGKIYRTTRVAKGEFAGALKERDTSATEVITFTPPTGVEAKAVLITELLVMSAIALAVMSIGIIIIKKKVVSKTTS